jgi:aconitase (EC 4.2.1.3)
MSRYGDQVLPIYDVAMKHQGRGHAYGRGRPARNTAPAPARDWAAKGTTLLGVRAVIVESFERIHRSNLVGMGVLPLQFLGGDNRQSLGLTGDDSFTIRDVAHLKPRQEVVVEVTRKDGSSFTFKALCRIDTANELEYFMNGGILHYVLRKLAA